jgi:hypothetical protein
MLFVEFLEFIGRLAEAKYKDNGQPLCQKIEAILEELCPAFGLVKKDVNLGVDDASESDEDY